MVLFSGILKFTLSLFILACGALFTACGGAETTVSNNTGARGSANSNGNTVVANVDPNVVNQPAANGAEQPNLAMANSQRQISNKGENIVSDGKNPDGSTGSAKPITRPAPDNSEYWSTLTDIAREYRVFRDHKQIKKVEKTTDGKTSTVKIFTSNGKVVNVPGERFPDIARVSVDQFVVAAGLKPIPANTPVAGPAVVNPDKK